MPPLSEPMGTGGGNGPFTLANGTVLYELEKRNTGSDTSISFRRSIWDYNSSRAVIGGDSGYVGTLASVGAKLAQAPDVSSSNCDALAMDQQNPGAMYFLNSVGTLELSDASLNNFAPVTPGGVTPISIFSLLGDNNIYLVFDELAGPQRNIAVSADQGATWDTNPGLFAPITGNARGAVTSRDGSLVCVYGGSGDIAVSNSPGTAWATLTYPNTNDINLIAFDADNSLLVAIDNIGQIYYTTDFLNSGALNVVALNSNPFVQTASSGATVLALNYVPALDGFVAVALLENIAVWIPLTTPEAPEQGVYLGSTSVFTGTPITAANSFIDDNGDFGSMFSSNAWIIATPG